MIKSATLFDITDMPMMADLVKGQPLQAGGVCIATYHIWKG